MGKGIQTLGIRSSVRSPVVVVDGTCWFGLMIHANCHTIYMHRERKRCGETATQSGTEESETLTLTKEMGK